jgi:hypothetical protein
MSQNCREIKCKFRGECESIDIYTVSNVSNELTHFSGCVEGQTGLALKFDKWHFKISEVLLGLYKFHSST